MKIQHLISRMFSIFPLISGLILSGVLVLGCEKEQGSSSDQMSSTLDMGTASRDQMMPTGDLGDMIDQTDQSTAVMTDRAVDSVLDQAPPANTDPFEVIIHDQERILSYGEENFQNAFGDFDLGSGPFSSVQLIIDLDTTCYPFERWRDDPPPMGHNWPPSCDAFDRNFELSLDPPENEGDPPAFEVMRAITPFGGPSHYEIDITDFANARPGVHRSQTHITTWSDSAGQVSGSQGGWTVSLQVRVVPGPAPRSVIAVLPLINTRIGAEGELPIGRFETPAGVTSSRLEYRVTGHGGGSDPSSACIGPAEEFCQRPHFIYADGRQIDQLTPWRDDCADLCTLETRENGANDFDYCLENPTGSIRSVRASRANWCPGSLTPPFVWEIDDYKEPGSHNFRFDILNVYEGGTWRVSAHVYLYGP